MTVVISSFAV